MDHLKRCKTSNFRCHFLDLSFHCFLGLIVSTSLIAGGQCTTDRHCPTKTLSVRGDTEPDQLCVPASIFHFSAWQPAKPSTGMSLFPTVFKPLYGFRNLLYYGLRQDGTVICAASELSCKNTSLRFLTSKSSKPASQFYWVVCAREMHSTSVIR